MTLLKSTLACLSVASLALGFALIAAPGPRATAAQPAAAAVAALEPVAQGGGFGTIKGKLVWGGENPPAPEKVANVTKDPQVCAVKPLIKQTLVVDPKTKGVEFGIAFVVNPKGKNAEMDKAFLKKHPKAEMDQKDCQFIPHVVGMTKDQEMIFKSSDPISHNLHYMGFTNGAKNVAINPNSEMKAKFVKESRPLTVNCDIHPWMSAYVWVFDHPFFAVTDKDGNFEITGVPAGEQNFAVWQEKVGYVTTGMAKGIPVTVKAGGVTDVGEVKMDPTKIKN
jgi:hypothetical protein